MCIGLVLSRVVTLLLCIDMAIDATIDSVCTRVTPAVVAALTRCAYATRDAGKQCTYTCISTSQKYSLLI